MRTAPGFPSVAGWTADGTAAAWSTARSSSGWRWLTTASEVDPAMNVTVMADEPSTTWSAVMMSPWSSTTTPLPTAVPEPAFGVALPGGSGAPLGPPAEGAGLPALAEPDGAGLNAAPWRVAWTTTTDGAMRAQAVSEK